MGIGVIVMGRRTGGSVLLMLFLLVRVFIIFRRMWRLGCWRGSLRENCCEDVQREVLSLPV